MKTLRIIAFLEGISFLSFGITMPLKYKLGMLLPNLIVGRIHGGLFIGYTLLVFITSFKISFTWKEKALLYLASIIPFGTFVVDQKILKNKDGK
jgi:integral membrane protein